MGASIKSNWENIYTRNNNPKMVNIPNKIIDKNNPIDIKNILSTMDYLDFVNRGTWYNLPLGLDGDMIERILYTKGKGCFFYLKELEKFYFLPYTSVGNLDVYNRPTKIKPMKYSTGNEEEQVLIPELIKNVKYEVDLDQEDLMDNFLNSALILMDTTTIYMNTIQPRIYYIESLLNGMSEVLPMARTNLIANSGLQGIKVATEEEGIQIKIASEELVKNSIKGNPWIPLVGQLDFQQLTGSTVNVEGYLSYFQSLDNFRLKSLGLTSGGIFEKKSHMLQDEMAMNSGKGSRILDDVVKNRQNFCLLANLIWGTNMWYEPSENSINMDIDGDMNTTRSITNETNVMNMGGEE